jgi:DNA-binding NarL/FixJ family response regulator
MSDNYQDRPAVLVVCGDHRRAEELRAGLVDAFVANIASRDDSQGTGAVVDVVVADLAGCGDSADRVIELRQQFHRPVVVLVDAPTEPHVVPPLAAGARGLVVSTSPRAVVAEAVRAVLDGGLYVDPAAAGVLVEVARLNARADRVEELTPAQLRVLSRFPRGLTNNEIADELGISVNTVKTHVRGIFTALGCDNRVEATRAAQRLGLLP